jgi:hypothetical protein
MFLEKNFHQSNTADLSLTYLYNFAMASVQASTPPLSQGYGYGIVLGLGFAFALGYVCTLHHPQWPI